MAFLCAEMIRSTPFHPPASWCGHGDTAAYTKDNDPVGFVRNSKVLYTSENEKEPQRYLGHEASKCPANCNAMILLVV